MNADTVATHCASDRRMVEVSELRGDEPFSLAVRDPTEHEVVHEQDGDWQILLAGCHEPVHRHRKSAVATHRHDRPLRVKQLQREGRWYGIAHASDGGRLQERTRRLGLE